MQPIVTRLRGCRELREWWGRHARIRATFPAIRAWYFTGPLISTSGSMMAPTAITFAVLDLTDTLGIPACAGLSASAADYLVMTVVLMQWRLTNPVRGHDRGVPVRPPDRMLGVTPTWSRWC
jgi:hypothetical protein